MEQIRVLPTELVNKIAAGEVVERPASVVKELVENALDAGASRIEIAVEDGGKRLIKVTDDGTGMSRPDAELAFRPHATSKIATDADLFAIETLGFRGEALASVASIGHGHLRTRRAGEDAGWEVSASGADVSEARPCAAPVGTTITVRDLFFNTPARRKFLRKANTELAHITEQLTRLALPRPDVAFSLSHNGREIQNLPAGQSTAARIADIFGADLADSLLPIGRRGGSVGVRGLAGRPQAVRASGKWQYFFLNGRFIRDRVLSHATKEAYRGLIDPGRWPVAFVFLELDPGEVDVNVHPTKIEVRFRDSRLVHGELLAALKETLNRADLAPGAVADRESDEARDAEMARRRQSLREAMADFFKSAAPSPQPRLNFSSAPGTRTAAPARTKGTAPAAAEQRAPDRTHPPEGRYVIDAGAAPLAPPRPMMQVHGSYIVAETDDGLVILDQHALHERLIYNDLKTRLAHGPLTGQRLLIPPTFNATPAEAQVLAEAGQVLGDLGMELEQFGPGVLAIQQFPSLLIERGLEPVAFLREVVDELAESGATDREQLLEGLLSIMACKAAVKAGSRLSEDEMLELLSRRAEAPKASSCPHGRPTALKMTLGDLAKQFKRT